MNGLNARRLLAGKALAAIICLHGTVGLACERVHLDARGRPNFLHPAGHVARKFGIIPDPILHEWRKHEGWDIVLPVATSVVVLAPGTVVEVMRIGPQDHTVAVDHGYGWRTLYAHLALTELKQGDCLKAHGHVGVSRSADDSERPFLHLEISKDGRPIDPDSVVPRERSSYQLWRRCPVRHRPSKLIRASASGPTSDRSVQRPR